MYADDVKRREGRPTQYRDDDVQLADIEGRHLEGESEERDGCNGSHKESLYNDDTFSGEQS
jgi:hypothetical protein